MQGVAFSLKERARKSLDSGADPVHEVLLGVEQFSQYLKQEAVRRQCGCDVPTSLGLENSLKNSIPPRGELGDHDTPPTPLKPWNICLCRPTCHVKPLKDGMSHNQG